MCIRDSVARDDICQFEISICNFRQIRLPVGAGMWPGEHDGCLLYTSPYRLLKLPMPDPIYDEGDCLTTNPESEGDRLPATYANFLILNKSVIYPTYNQPEKDEKARKQIQRCV